MNEIKRLVQEQTARLPEMAMRRILERKLKRQNIELPEAAFEALVAHCLKGDVESFVWRDSDESSEELSNFILEFDDQDSAEIAEIGASFTERLSDALRKATATSGRELFEELKQKWTVEGALQQHECDGFRERLEDRWGEGLGLLRLLLTCVREMGDETAKRHRKSKSTRHHFRRFVLQRLHVRACQVADEIVTLLENGFADGAMARWRTLHEIDVTAAVIEDGDEDLALRYVEHDIVEIKKQADDFDEKQVPLGYSPIAPQKRKRIDRDYADVLRRYGSEFRTDYGWAAKHLNEKRPTFKQLQDKANQSGMNTYYKLANFQVHAGARSIFFRLSDMGTREVLLAGRSNAGLVEPGQNTAYTLVRITGALLGRPYNLASLIGMASIVQMRDAIPPALQKADRRLRRDEAKFVRENAQLTSARVAKRRASAPLV